MKIYTRKGDDGTTGLLYGGRVPKDSALISANGAVDEAQAALGVARAATEPGSELDQRLIALEREEHPRRIVGRRRGKAVVERQRPDRLQREQGERVSIVPGVGLLHLA